VYHALPIVNEERTDVRVWRAAALGYVRRQLTAALATMGIDVPARM
jgi:arginyl-tRNA synthetase